MELNIFSQQFKYNLAIFFTFSSISSILSGTIGIHYGHVLIHFKVIAENSAPTCMFFSKRNAVCSRKLLICRLTRRDWSTGFWWAFHSLCSAFSYTSRRVFILHIYCQTWLPFTIPELRLYMYCSVLAAIPINKQLYSFSYVCFTGGAAGIVLSAFYILVWFMFHFRQETSSNSC